MSTDSGPAERMKAAVDDVADAAWDVAGGLLGLAIVDKGVEVAAGGGEPDDDGGDEAEE